MKSAISIDKAGRLVLPQQVRRRFHLLAGDSLDLEVVTDGIFLRAHSRQADLVEENGLLVHQGRAVGELDQIVADSRSDRDADILGLHQ